MRNKKARKSEQLFIYFVVFLHSINKNQVVFISALEGPRIPAHFPKGEDNPSTISFFSIPSSYHKFNFAGIITLLSLGKSMSEFEEKRNNLKSTKVS